MAVRKLGLNKRLDKNRKDRAKSGKGGVANETFREQMLRRLDETDKRLDALEAAQTPKPKQRR